MVFGKKEVTDVAVTKRTRKANHTFRGLGVRVGDYLYNLKTGDVVVVSDEGSKVRLVKTMERNGEVSVGIQRPISGMACDLEGIKSANGFQHFSRIGERVPLVALDKTNEEETE